MTEPTSHTECGVHYYRQPCHGYLGYQYRWEVVRDGKRHEGTAVVYCRNQEDFFKLLDFWNHSDYKYTSILGQVGKPCVNDTYVCDFCGVYKATKPRCNKCEKEQ